MRITPGERRTLTLVGAAIAILLAWTIGIGPWLAEPLRGPARRALSLRLAEAERLLARARAIEARRDALAAAVAEAEKGYPAETSPERAAVSLLRLGEDFARASGLEIRARGIRSSSAKEVPPRVRVEIEGIGAPRAVIGFLDRVRLARVRLAVERLEIAPEGDRRLRLYAVLATLLPGAGEEGGRDR